MVLAKEKKSLIIYQWSKYFTELIYYNSIVGVTFILIYLF
jgi:hypothetical protein